MFGRQTLCALTPAPIRLGRLEVDLDRPAIEIPAIQAGNGGTRLMAFHLNKTKSLALAGKYIGGKLQGTYGAEFGKQGLQVLFAGTAG